VAPRAPGVTAPPIHRRLRWPKKKKKSAPLFQNVRVLEVSSGAIEFQFGCRASVFKYNCNALEFLRMPTEVGAGADFQ
jgi:hypothetical protein